MQGSSFYWLLGLGAISAFLMFRAHRQFRRTTLAHAEVRGAREISPIANFKPVEAQRWEVEMHETMRAWSGQLDTKLRLLQQTIQLAEQAAARLESAIAEARNLPESVRRPLTMQPTTSPTNSASQADYLRASLKSVAATADRAPMPESTSGGRPTEQIHALADAGHDAASIAKQVGSPIGEVELILGLRRNLVG